MVEDRLEVRRTHWALLWVVFLVVASLLGVGCSSREASPTATQRVSPTPGAHEEEAGHDLHLALVALGVGEVADARRHVLHFQESVNPEELELGAEILDLLERNELHDAKHKIQELLGDDRVRGATLRGLAAAATPQGGAMRFILSSPADEPLPSVALQAIAAMPSRRPEAPLLRTCRTRLPVQARPPRCRQL